VNLKKNVSADMQTDVPEKKRKKRKPAKAKEQDLVIEAVGSPDEEKKEKEEIKEKEQLPPQQAEPGTREAAAKEEVPAPADEVLTAIKEDLERILDFMGFASEVTVRFDEQSVQCNIKSDYEENIVGQEGRTLDSLQYLIRKIASSSLPDRMTVDLDIGNFREQRVQELQKIALEMAGQVKETGKTMAIPALNPSERRVVHVALQDDKKVRSRSVGDGIFKKVLIFKPGSKGRKTGGRRRGRQGGGSAQQ